jgi:hypothetical protein
VSVYPLIVARLQLGRTFPLEVRIVRGVVFYAVRVLSKENRRLVLPRTFFIITCY